MSPGPGVVAINNCELEQSRAGGGNQKQARAWKNNSKKNDTIASLVNHNCRRKVTLFIFDTHRFLLF